MGSIFFHSPRLLWSPYRFNRCPGSYHPPGQHHCWRRKLVHPRLNNFCISLTFPTHHVYPTHSHVPLFKYGRKKFTKKPNTFFFLTTQNSIRNQKTTKYLPLHHLHNQNCRKRGNFKRYRKKKRHAPSLPTEFQFFLAPVDFFFFFFFFVFFCCCFFFFVVFFVVFFFVFCLFVCFQTLRLASCWTVGKKILKYF